MSPSEAGPVDANRVIPSESPFAATSIGSMKPAGPQIGYHAFVMFPGDTATSLEQLRLAVPGLAGLVGFMLLPTLGAWFRLALETMESSRAHLGRPKRVSTLSSLRAGLFSVATAFFTLTLFRAAGELRSIETEAAVVGPSVQGMVIGIAFWVVYGLCLSTLRADAARFRGERRVGWR